MPGGSRKSTRDKKLNRKEDFVYEEEFLTPLSQSYVSSNVPSDVWQHRTNTVEGGDTSVNSVRTVSDSESVVDSDNSVIKALTTWSVIENLPVFPNLDLDSNTSSATIAIPISASSSQSHFRNSPPTVYDALVQCSSSDVNKVPRRKKSSTRWDIIDSNNTFIDLDNNYLSAASSEAFPVMSDSDNIGEGTKKCGCKKDEASGCSECSPATEPSLADLMVQAIRKIDHLSGKVKGLESRLTNLETKSDSESDSDTKSNRSHRKGKNSHSSKKSSGASRKVKNSKVGEEKHRQRKVFKDQLKDRQKKKEESDDESDEVSSSGEGEEADMHGIRKKMSSKQKKKCNQKVKSRVSQAGGNFPSEEDYDDSSSPSSGNESSGSKSSHKHRRRHKVRSGAKIKRRPVVRTELWPHTIAVEEEGIEVTCDDISLPKFLSCFTHIMTRENCDGSEEAGRSLLLHAIMAIYECLPWAEARTFHNVVMIKVEQDRLSWEADFDQLAEDFINSKLKQCLKSKGASYGTYKGNTNYNGKYNRKEFSGYGGRSNNSGQASSYSNVCKQWNFATCTYGARCKRWHCCWSCYEAGRRGEQHKASSHGSSNNRDRPEPGNQRL